MKRLFLVGAGITVVVAALSAVFLVATLWAAQSSRIGSVFPRDPNGIALESYANHEFDSYQLVAATDSGTNLRFAQQVFLVGVYNPGPEDVYVDFDAVASTADWLIPAATEKWIRRQCRTVHAYSTGTPTVRVTGLW